MDLLPPELIVKIFEFLPVRDTIRLRVVCKQWYHLMNYLKHRSLTVFHENMLDDDMNDLRPLKSADWLKCKDEDLLLASPLPPMLNRVRKLSTYLYSETIIDLSKFYNQFERLEELTCYHHYVFEKPI